LLNVSSAHPMEERNAVVAGHADEETVVEAAPSGGGFDCVVGVEGLRVRRGRRIMSGFRLHSRRQPVTAITKGSSFDVNAIARLVKWSSGLRFAFSLLPSDPV